MCTYFYSILFRSQVWQDSLGWLELIKDVVFSIIEIFFTSDPLDF
jgi:hypothetical protein